MTISIEMQKKQFKMKANYMRPAHTPLEKFNNTAEGLMVYLSTKKWGLLKLLIGFNTGTL